MSASVSQRVLFATAARDRRPIVGVNSVQELSELMGAARLVLTKTQVDALTTTAGAP